MKKKHIIIGCVLLVGIVFPGIAFADSQRTGYHKGPGFKQHHQGGGLMLLAGYQQKNMWVQVLSEMTGQSKEAIQLKLNNQHMRSLMKEFGIDRRAFHVAMRAKETEMIKQAAAEGSITPEQEKEIFATIEKYTKRRELMRKLVEKGIEDGTITQEEALMLLRKPH